MSSVTYLETLLHKFKTPDTLLEYLNLDPKVERDSDFEKLLQFTCDLYNGYETARASAIWLPAVLEDWVWDEPYGVVANKLITLGNIIRHFSEINEALSISGAQSQDNAIYSRGLCIKNIDVV